MTLLIYVALCISIISWPISNLVQINSGPYVSTVFMCILKCLDQENMYKSAHISRSLDSYMLYYFSGFCVNPELMVCPCLYSVITAMLQLGSYSGYHFVEHILMLLLAHLWSVTIAVLSQPSLEVLNINLHAYKLKD